MKRFIVIDDPKVKSLIKSKDELAKKVEGVTKEIAKLEEDRNKLVLKIQRYNDKAVPLIKPYQKEEALSEFEDYSRLYLEEDELRLEVFDNVEEYKIYLRNQKEEAKKKKDGTKSDTTSKDNNK